MILMRDLLADRRLYLCALRLERQSAQFAPYSTRYLGADFFRNEIVW